MVHSTGNQEHWKTTMQHCQQRRAQGGVAQTPALCKAHRIDGWSFINTDLYWILAVCVRHWAKHCNCVFFIISISSLWATLKLFEELTIFYMYECLHKCMPVHHMHIVPVQARKECQISWNYIYKWLWVTLGAVPNPNILEEQSKFLTIEPSL